LVGLQHGSAVHVSPSARYLISWLPLAASLVELPVLD
jgi:hypothetical protein